MYLASVVKLSTRTVYRAELKRTRFGIGKKKNFYEHQEQQLTDNVVIA